MNLERARISFATAQPTNIARRAPGVRTVKELVGNRAIQPEGRGRSSNWARSFRTISFGQGQPETAAFPKDVEQRFFSVRLLRHVLA